MASVTNNFTDTITMTYTGNGKAVSAQTGTYPATHDAGVATVIPAGSVSLEVDVAFPFATIQSCIVASDQALTIDVNSTATPVPALTVSKTIGVVWGADFPSACPFTANVTKMYVSNPGTADAKFNVRVAYN